MNGSMGDGWPVRAAWAPGTSPQPLDLGKFTSAAVGAPLSSFVASGVQIGSSLRDCPRLLGFSAAGGARKSPGPVMLRGREPGGGAVSE